MDVDLRPVKKLRESAAARSALGPIMEAVCASPADLARLRVVCDWIQYRQNFAEPVACRPVLAEPPGEHGHAGGLSHGRQESLEIAIDLRRSGDTDVATRIKEMLAAPPDAAQWVVLEPWVPASESCIWRFNRLYWQALSRWEQATGREYEQALPGGRSEARDTDVAGDLIRELLRVWDELDARRALPEELYIAELGVGNGSQARTWLDTFDWRLHRAGLTPVPVVDLKSGSHSSGAPW